jgi:hypothetical protein
MVAKGQKKGNSMSGLPKIETPVFNVELPSDKEKSVTMRVMKVKEEKILLMAKQSNDPMEVLAAIKQVVNNCLVNYEKDHPNWKEETEWKLCMEPVEGE